MVESSHKIYARANCLESNACGVKTHSSCTKTRGTFSKYVKNKDRRTQNFSLNFKAVPFVRATYKERARLPRSQGTTSEVFLKRTNGSEVMGVFLTLDTLKCFFVCVSLLELIFSKSRKLNRFEFCAKGFLTCIILR